MSVTVSGAARRFRVATLLTDRRSRSLILQALALLALVSLLAFLVNNTIQNLRTLGQGYGFGFLGQPANYDINQTLVPYTSQSTHGRAVIVGLLNTLVMAVAGIVMATVLGFIFGVARLSRNWLVSRIVTIYIELARNIPLLLQILLWHVVILQLPPVRKALDLGAGVFLSNRGLTIPTPVFEAGFGLVIAALLLAVAGAVAFAVWAKRDQDRTGRIWPVFSVNCALIVLLPLLAWFVAGRPLSWVVPELGRFNLQGGVTLIPEFVALWAALSLYTAAFIAENVRSGIQAVARGQTEAAYSLGLRPGRTMRLIIIPQAMRVIIPPLASQYLNLTKNSSLAIAIGYMDITATLGGITLNQTGRAMECVMLLMLIYLCISLTTSAFMNWYNRRVRLVER